MVGPAGGAGEESFDVVVCTPSWLHDQLGPTEMKMGRHFLLVKRYDFAALKRFVTNFVADCRGATWQEAAHRMGRLGKWEFEDYSD